MDSIYFLNSLVSDLTGTMNQKGDLFGLELELEGRNVGLQDVPTKNWKRTHDGSLRGESIEYVFSKPLPFKETNAAINLLFKKFKEAGVQPVGSVRTSTHVHLNFSDRPLKKALNFFFLFTMLEELLEKYSGEDRGGNLFCLSSRHTEQIINLLKSAIERGTFRAFAGDAYKYAACNLSTLYKFGTVEVRTMRGADSAEQVKNWVEILNDMYQYCEKNVKSPVDLVSSLSYRGIEGFLRDIFSDNSYKELMGSWPKAFDPHASVLEGARLFQMLAYEFEESFVQEPKELPNGDVLNCFFNGQRIRILTPRYNSWSITPISGRDYFVDGEACIDDPHLVYRAVLGRFVCIARGDAVPLKWKRGPQGQDETLLDLDGDDEDEDRDYDEDEEIEL